MKSQKVTIYIRLCGEPGRPFEKVKVRNPRQCGARDHYCLRVGGKWEFFAEDDPARTELNAALRRLFERDQALRLGVAAPAGPQPKAEAQSVGNEDTAIRRAITQYIDALHTENNLRPRTIKDKQTELERWADCCPAQRLEEVKRQHLIAFRDWFRKEGYQEWTTKINLTTVVTRTRSRSRTPSRVREVRDFRSTQFTARGGAEGRLAVPWNSNPVKGR